ncbi:MAG: bifunctional diguanylate cyclase/phosphodiesterase [Marinobacter sp.]|uniref:bifunctional diguanylate cyclase/phosphodiesterase n=1 Tax=Marinobacter sp. TaxID=50741 RepID=UPI003F9E132B
MAVLKRNIWALFLLTVLLGAVILTALLYQRWQSVLSDQTAYHKSRATLVYQSVNSFLRTQELVLDVIGRELLYSGDVFQGRGVMPLLDGILATNPALITFGLADMNGNLIRVSSNIDPYTVPNLRANPKTVASFNRALESDRMVVGRTYYVGALNEWVIPVRKTLRSPDGLPIAVMTAGLRLGSKGLIFNQQLHDSKEDSVILFRENDRYVQFMSKHNVGPEQYADIHYNEAETGPKAGLFEPPVGPSKQQQIVAGNRAVIYFSGRHDTDYLAAAIYDSEYQLWTISETAFSPLYRQLFGIVLFYVSGFVIIVGILYALFRVIDRAELTRQRELLYQARHDDLTGLLNRAGLLDRLERLLGHNKPFSLIVINIDNFSGINDRFGLKHGDDMLIEFGRRLTGLIHGSDELARLGSDEFMILTPNTDTNQLLTACASLVQNLAQTFAVGRLHLQVGVRIGVARFPEDGRVLGELIRSAHLALFQAKLSQTAVCVYQPEMETAYLRGLTIEQRLRFGLVSGALHMVYQTQVDQHGTVTGLEALVRWQDEELGFVSPAEFVEVAERSGLMIPLGNFVLSSSLQEFRELTPRHGQPLDLAINISVIQFCQVDFVDNVLAALEAHGVSPRHLVLEITETLSMGNFQQVLDTVRGLRAHGIRVAMDDFGTGYSSLSLLRRLPLDELKIDKSFVDAIVDDEKATNMVRSIVAIAQSHNMSLIAEGVERRDQADTLIGMGCLRFQGYYFSRPAPMDELITLLGTAPGSRHGETE